MSQQIVALMTTKQAAAYLNVKPGTLEQWRWYGNGPPFVKMGRTVRYRLADLNEYIDSQIFSSTSDKWME